MIKPFCVVVLCSAGFVSRTRFGWSNLFMFTKSCESQFSFDPVCQKNVLSWRCSNCEMIHWCACIHVHVLFEPWDDSQTCLHTCPCWCLVSETNAKRSYVDCFGCYGSPFFTQVRFGFKWVRVVWAGFVPPNLCWRFPTLKLCTARNLSVQLYPQQSIGIRVDGRNQLDVAFPSLYSQQKMDPKYGQIYIAQMGCQWRWRWLASPARNKQKQTLCLLLQHRASISTWWLSSGNLWELYFQ